MYNMKVGQITFFYLLSKCNIQVFISAIFQCNFKGIFCCYIMTFLMEPILQSNIPLIFFTCCLLECPKLDIYASQETGDKVSNSTVTVSSCIMFNSFCPRVLILEDSWNIRQALKIHNHSQNHIESKKSCFSVKTVSLYCFKHTCAAACFFLATAKLTKLREVFGLWLGASAGLTVG